MGCLSPLTFTYGLGDICARLGQSGHTPRWQVRYVDRLIERYGFPPPNPLMIGERFVDTAHANSRWPIVAVDRWFVDRLPPDTAAAEDRAARRAAEADMDARAQGLGRGLRLVGSAAA